MTAAAEAAYEITYPTERRARLVARSLSPELDQIDDDRSTARLHRDGLTVAVEVDAADLVALRAATNTWLSLVTVAERAAENVGF